MFLRVAHLTTLKHIVLIAENVCDLKCHTKSECSRYSISSQNTCHPYKVVSLPLCHLMIYFFSPNILFYLVYQSFPSIVSFSLKFSLSKVLIPFPTCISISLSELKDFLGKYFPFNFSCLPSPFQ